MKIGQNLVKLFDMMHLRGPLKCKTSSIGTKYIEQDGREAQKGRAKGSIGQC